MWPLLGRVGAKGMVEILFLSVQSNLASDRAGRFFRTQQGRFLQSVERLSSGYRITRFADDVGSMARNEQFKSRLQSANAVVLQVNENITMAQRADSSLAKIEASLQLIRTLAQKSANQNYSTSEREAFHSEAIQLLQDVTELARTTKYNSQTLLDGSFQSKLFQVGIDVGDKLGVNFPSAKSNDIGAHRVPADGSLSSVTAGAASVGALSHPVLGTEQMVISGHLGQQSVTPDAGASAKNIASQINAVSGETGVSARAETHLKLTSLSAAASTTLEVTADNTTAASATSTVSATNDLTSLMNAVNAYSSTTGVTATAGSTAGELLLEHPEGQDVGIDFGSATAGATISAQGQQMDGTDSGSASTLTEGGNDSMRVGGQVLLESTHGFSVSSTVAGSLFSATANQVSSHVSAATINISTQAGGRAAISVVDMALEAVRGFRAEAGATEDRFQRVASSLTDAIESLTSAQSTLQNTEYAQELARKARTEIFLDAGASVLAQANVIPELAIKLIESEYSILD
jgi:flagellin